MKEKTRRLEELRRLISEQELSSQEEVLQVLKKEGYVITQATLSRDLKQLKVSKMVTLSGKYAYVLPTNTNYRHVPSYPQTREDWNAGFLSLDFSDNIGVIKTHPGYAAVVAYNIDKANIPQVLGTIAGDDTVLVVIKKDADSEYVKHMLESILV